MFNRPMQWPLILAAVAIGFLAGRLTGDSGRPATGDSISGADMKIAMAEALSVPSDSERLSRIVDLVDLIDLGNAPGAGEALSESSSSAAAAEVQIIMSAWARLDPHAAFESIRTWSLLSKRKFGATAVATEWAQSGRGIQARDYIYSLPQVELQIPALRGLFRGWGRSAQLDGVTLTLAAIEEIDTREAMTTEFVNALLGAKGVEGVIEWVDSVPIDTPSKLKKTVYKKSLRQVANRDPERAARWLSENDGQDYAARSLQVVAGEWAEHDPEVAIDWLLNHTTSVDFDTALHRWINRWTSTDYEAAAAWMEQADLTGPLDGLLDRFISVLTPRHPEVAAEWWGKLDRNDPDRKKIAVKILKVWRATDPEAASEWRREQRLSNPTLRPVDGAPEDASP